MNFHDPQILSQIHALGYPAMFILMVIEGPIATLIPAFGAKLGFFNIYIVFFLSLAGDILGDIILYGIGYQGGTKALSRAASFLRIQPRIVEKLENLFHRHGKKTIFAVKSTTGLCWITFIAAGAVRMDLGNFLIGSLSGGFVWSGFLTAIGYFFGYAFESISQTIQYAGIIIFCLAVIFYLGLSFYRKYQSQKIVENSGQ